MWKGEPGHSSLSGSAYSTLLSVLLLRGPKFSTDDFHYLISLLYFTALFICSELRAAETSGCVSSKTMKLLKMAKEYLLDSCLLEIKSTQIILVAILLIYDWKQITEGFVVIALNALLELLSFTSH